MDVAQKQESREFEPALWIKESDDREIVRWQMREDLLTRGRTIIGFPKSDVQEMLGHPDEISHGVSGPFHRLIAGSEDERWLYLVTAIRAKTRRSYVHEEAAIIVGFLGENAVDIVYREF